MLIEDRDTGLSLRSFDRRHATIALVIVAVLIALPFADIGPPALRSLAADIVGLGPNSPKAEQAYLTPAPAVPDAPPQHLGTAPQRSDPAPQRSDAPTPEKETAVVEAPQQPVGDKAPVEEPASGGDAQERAPAPQAAEPRTVQAPPVARLYFDMRQEDLSAEAQETLKPFVAYLNENADAAVRIVGYFPRGDSASGPNATLMWRRTLAVREAFEGAGISGDRVIALRPIDARNGSGPTARRIDVAIAAAASPIKGRRVKSKARLGDRHDAGPPDAVQLQEVRQAVRPEIRREDASREERPRDAFPLNEIHRGEIF